MKKIIYVLAFILGISLPAWAKDYPNSIDQFDGKRIAVLTSSVTNEFLLKRLPKAEPVEFNSTADKLEALNSGRVDVVMENIATLREVVRLNPGRYILFDELISVSATAPAVKKSDVELAGKIDRIIKNMWADGTIKKLDDKWFGNDESQKRIDIVLQPTNGTLRLGTFPQMSPLSFVKDGKVVGYDVEIMYIVAKELGMGLEISTMDFPALVPALVSNRVNIITGSIMVTPERSEQVLFVEGTYRGGMALMNKATAVVEGVRVNDKGFIAGLKESLYKNFVFEDRYKLFVQGLISTIVIVVGAAFCGTILAFIVCLSRRSNIFWLRYLAMLYIRLVQGTPIVVLLMIFYYIIFARTELSSISIAIIAFSINFAAYVSEMLRTAIDAVDIGQIEAAKALGFNTRRVYLKIVLPQALRYVLPIYKGELIAMLKMTSVVGYIAIQDLTKVSDIVRARTYEAFFPIIITAVMYFLLAYIFIVLLDYLERCVDPKRRKRCLEFSK